MGGGMIGGGPQSVVVKKVIVSPGFGGYGGGPMGYAGSGYGGGYNGGMGGGYGPMGGYGGLWKK